MAIDDRLTTELASLSSLTVALDQSRWLRNVWYVLACVSQLSSSMEYDEPKTSLLHNHLIILSDKRLRPPDNGTSRSPARKR